MNRHRFSYKPISSKRSRRTSVRPAQMVVALIALLLVLGSLALVATLDALRPDLLALAQAQQALPSLTTEPTAQPQFTPTQSPPLRTPLFHGNVRLHDIALTFDDGPLPSSTPQILAILQHFGIQATFFCIGRQVQLYPAVVRQEYLDGNLVEDHTWSHPDLRYLSAAAVRRQLVMTAQAIYQITGTQPTFFRPPYGAVTPAILNQARQFDLSTVMWTVDPRDWSLPGSQVIITRVLGSVTNGSIILLHDGGGNRIQTIAALPTIITTLQKRGFHFVTIQQMVEDL